MDGRNGLLVFGAFLMSALVILLVAAYGLWNYGVSRVAGPAHLVPTELQPTDVRSPSRVADLTVTTPGTLGDTEQRNRIRLLEHLLEKKNQQIREQAQQITHQRQTLRQLQSKYDEAITRAIEVLDGEMAEPPAAASTTEPDETPDQNPELVKLRADLAAADAVQEKLGADLEQLQNELTEVYASLTDEQTMPSDSHPMPIDTSVELEATLGDVVVGIGAPAIPSLLKALKHADPTVRRWATTVLGAIGPDAEDAVHAVRQLLSDSDPEVRRAARQALESIER